MQIKTDDMVPTRNVLEFRRYRMGLQVDETLCELIDGLSFSVRQSSVLGVVGESGCGKSMTALSVLRLLPAAAVVMGGEILFNGENLLAKTEAEMEKIRGRDIAMVFQEPMTSLNPVHTVGRQIAEVFLTHRPQMGAEERRTTAIALLRQVGIANPEQRFDQFPHQLSGGMRQRVMIAIAVACRPQILLADEPTTALDGTIQAQVLSLMQELKQQTQGSIMLITHNLGVVAETCDEVVIMYAGRIVERGSIANIFDQPAHPYTRGLLASLPSLVADRGELYSIPGSVPTVDNLEPGCRFAPRCSMRREVCTRKVPALAEVRSGHAVACWVTGPGAEL
ncbi:MAG: ABC transporter ATP-binding protein [Burkholderiales bacterium]|nr:ABC transporter ATP-binding protein [Burkholderiales bacterium]